MEETEEQDFIFFEGNRTPYIMLSSLAGKKAEEFKFTGKMSDARPGGWDPDERTNDQDIDGIDAEVLYGGGPLRTENRELAVASHRAYNEWLADFCKGWRRSASSASPTCQCGTWRRRWMRSATPPRSASGVS